MKNKTLSRTPWERLFIAAIVSIFFIFYAGPFFRLFSANLMVETPFSYQVTDKVKTQRPTPMGISVPFQFPSQKMTTLHVSAWVLWPGSLLLSVENKTDGTSFQLAHRPVLRHMEFDLTPHLRIGKEYVVSLSVQDPNQESASIVQEFVIKQMPQLRRFPPLHWIVLALAFLLVARRKAAPVELLFAMAFAVRWHALAATVGHPLEGDAGGYSLLVQQFQWSHPFATDIREPLYIWLQCVIFNLFGHSELLFRFTTVTLSMGIVVLTYLLGEALSKSRRIAAIAAAVLSFGEFAVWNSTRGERSELYTFLLLAFCLLLIRSKRVGWKHEGILGGLAGLVSLTWLIGAVSCALAYLCRWIWLKIPAKVAGVFFITFIVLLLPHLHYQYRVSGDAFRALNAHANFYRNAHETGTPSYEGGPHSLARYIVVERGLTLVRQTLSGYFEVFLNPQNPFNKVFLGFHYTENKSFFLYPFLVLGIFVTLYDRRVWVFLMLFSVLNVSVAFQNDVRDPRLFLQAAFFIAYFFGVGVDKLALKLGGLASKLRA